MDAKHGNTRKHDNLEGLVGAPAPHGAGTATGEDVTKCHMKRYTSDGSAAALVAQGAHTNEDVACEVGCTRRTLQHRRARIAALEERAGRRIEGLGVRSEPIDRGKVTLRATAAGAGAGQGGKQIRLA